MTFVLGMAALLVLFAIAWALDGAANGILRRIGFAIADRVELGRRRKR
jgi:hypothetical protein